MVEKGTKAGLVDKVELPLLPLKDIVVFPHMIVPVFINEDLCVKAVERALAADRRIFLSAFKVVGVEGEGLDCALEPPFDVYDVGTICSVMRTRKLPDGRMKVLVQGLQKATIRKLVESKKFPVVDVAIVNSPPLEHPPSEVEALVRAVRESLEKVVSLGKVLSPDILMILEDVKEPGRLSDLVAANLGFKVEQAQKILSVDDPVERLSKVHAYLSREVEVYQMQMRIQSQAKEEIGKMQREHYLREQIRALKSELGDIDPKDEIEELWRKAEEANLSKEARDEVTKQIRRLERMHQDTSDASLTKTHVETILSLPWSKYTEDKIDLQLVLACLDEDHYGLSAVKDRIVEYLAVKKLNPESKGPILCFVGPPGVGKTSLGRSVARAMGRKFSRISLGGVRDEADVRGHRKTYVGAFPGRIIQSLKLAESANPIIMLDEIDKLGSDHRGDPASALLEVLDPEQNHAYVDHYLSVPFDLSKVMFIANANTLETIPLALRDRLEVIEVSGYSELEKVRIANRFLIPKQIKEAGLATQNVILTKQSVQCLIRGYTRESGLRNLERQLASICRKIARNVAETTQKDSPNHVRVTPAMVQRFLGARTYSSQFFHSEPAIGVALGMAYTQTGGEILAIETNILSGSGKLVLTGQLGDVMKESAHAALSFIRSQSSTFGLAEKEMDDKDYHIHVPQGAVPKDGPSAGVALVTSILSALLKVPPREKLCMTGEITLHGKVLPVGGLKEKVLAAQREGIDTVVMPEGNKPVYDCLDAHNRKKISPYFIGSYVDIFEFLFPSVSSRNMNDRPQAVELAG